MAEVGSAFVSIIPSAKGFGTKMNREIGSQVNSSAKTAGTRFGKVFAYSSMSPLKAIGAAAVGLFAASKVKEFISDSVKSLSRIERINTQTAQVIKSTGGAAGVSAKHVENLAGRLENLTASEAETTQEGANLLLTFTNIKNGVGQGDKIFDQATRTIVDMSRALGQDAKSSALQLGKALNDPIKGVTALQRVGVSFTQGQKDTISTLVDSGKTMQAQKLILGELTKEFGGSGKAFAQTTEGKFALAGHAFGTFGETITAKLMPPLANLATFAANGLNALAAMGPRINAVFDRIVTAVRPAVTAIASFAREHMQPLITILSGAGGAAVAAFASLIGGTLVSAIGLLVGALASPVAIVGALAGAALYAYTHFEGFRNTVNNLVAALRANLTPVLQTAATTFQGVILPAVAAVVGYVRSALLPVFGQVAGIITSRVLPIVSSLAQFFYGTLVPTVAQVVRAVASNLKPVFDQLVATFRGKVLPSVNALLAKFQEWQPTIQKVVVVVVKIIGKVLEFAAAILGKVLPVVIRFAGFLLGTFVSAIIAGANVLGRIIGDIIQTSRAFADGVKAVGKFATAVGEKINEALRYVASIPGKVVSALGNVGSLLYNAGKSIIQGLIDGVGAMIGTLKSKLSAITDLIPKVKGPPAKDAALLRPAGRLIMRGLVDGIDDGIDPLTRKLGEVTDKIRDKIKGQLAGLRSDAASLASSVSGAFTSGLLDAKATDAIAAARDNVWSAMAPTGGTPAKSASQNFIESLLGKRGELTKLTAAFSTLKGFGYSPGFLAQLFQSGNAGLILDLAADQNAATQAASLFDDVNSLSAGLGQSVAGNQFGADIRSLEARLDKGQRRHDEKQDKTNRLLEDLPRALAGALNGVAAPAGRSSGRGPRRP